MELTQDIKKLFKKVRTQLGAPIRRIELDDNQMCDLLEVAIGEYAEQVQNFIIEQNWLNLMGNNTFMQNPQDLAYAMSIRNLDFSRDFSYWFSKEVGLQQRGTKWELNKDFIQIEKGKQNYLIPAGREINKVMYVTPSTTKAALFGANMGGMWDGGFAMGLGQTAGSFNGSMGLGGFYIGSAYDTALLAADLKYKNSLLRGDLAYKVTAGPNGTHILHLLSTPGSPRTFGGLAADDTWGWHNYAGCYVWYTYYDTSNASDDEIDACRLENRDDILLTPDQVPLDEMKYELLNNPTQQTVRRLLYAECCKTIALIRGYASGVIKIPNAEMQLDYNMLMDLGKTEKQEAMEELKERLKRMMPWEMMKNYSDLTESLINIQKQKPLETMLVR